MKREYTWLSGHGVGGEFGTVVHCAGRTTSTHATSIVGCECHRNQRFGRTEHTGPNDSWVRRRNQVLGLRSNHGYHVRNGLATTTPLSHQLRDWGSLHRKETVPVREMRRRLIVPKNHSSRRSHAASTITV